MRLRAFGLLLAAGLVAALVPLARAADLDLGQTDEQALRVASLTPDGPSLLDFFRQRTRGSADRKEIETLVRQLSAESPAQREKATGELVALGSEAVPWLRLSAHDLDQPEAAGRARRCLQLIEGSQASAIPAAAARLLAVRRPEGAAEVLLAYLPFADDDSVREEVKNALAAVAYHDGKPDPALVAALDEEIPLRRAAAAEALSRGADDAMRGRLHKLLQDSRPNVALRVALALARTGKDPKAVSTLIALLADVSPAEARLAEDYLVELAGDQAPKVPLGEDDIARQRCRDTWASWWLSTEGPGLLDEFRKRTLTDDLREKALALVKQLGDDSFDVREQAMTELESMGGAIASILRQHANDPDLEVSARTRKVLQAVEKEKATPLSPVTVRLVGLRKPPGAAEVLLAFLPFADDEGTIAEVESALAALAVRDGKADPALVKALADHIPLRRGVAGAALWQAGAVEERAAVRKLLQDPDPQVRLRVALTLAGSREKEAVPVLIALLAELAPTDAAPAEEFLRRVAGEQGPTVGLGTEQAERQKCRDAWAAWWHDNEASIDLARAGSMPRYLGYTMILYLNPVRVVELGPDGKTRWQIDGLNYCYDAVVLPGDRVLIAEYNGGRVTERTTKNQIVWEKQVTNPISAQRLANGNTFITSRNQFVEVDRAGRDVRIITRPMSDILSGQKCRDGTILCVTQQGMLLHLDATGKELKSFGVGPSTLGGLEALPNGRALVAQYNANKVSEYDAEGKQVWEASVPWPTGATRLPNGNTLVASQNTNQVVELDHSGKVVWDSRLGQQPWKARRR